MAPMLSWSRSRNRLLALGLLGVALATLQLSSSAVMGQEAVDVTGQVLSGTSGQLAPEDLAVTLHVIGEDGGIDVLTATTDGDGRFRFTDVELRDGASYAVAASYHDVLYSVSLDSNSLSRPVELMVFETTDSLDYIRVETDLLFVRGADRGKESISLVEVVSLVNDGDRTFVPDLTQPARMKFLRFSRPAGAQDVQVSSDLPGGQIIPVGTGFALTAPVQPGPHQVTYTYRLPYDGDAADLVHSFPMGAQTFRLLLHEEAGELVAPERLTALPPAEVGEKTYGVWQASQLEPGTKLTLKLDNLARQPFHQRLGEALTDGPYLKIGIPVAVGLGMAAILVYVLAVKGAARAPASATADEATGSSQDQRRSLVGEIARLDDLYEAGQLERQEHQRLRERLKTRLLRLSLDAVAE